MFTRELYGTDPNGTYFLGGPAWVRLAVLFGTVPSVPVKTQSLSIPFWVRFHLLLKIICAKRRMRIDGSGSNSGPVIGMRVFSPATRGENTLPLHEEIQPGLKISDARGMEIVTGRHAPLTFHPGLTKFTISWAHPSKTMGINT